MKSLLILRHAKSSWKHEGLSDHDRPLNKRGKRDAPRIGRLLGQRDLVPEAILSSTAVRAARTALEVAGASGYPGEIVHLEDLYLAQPSTYLEAVQSVTGDPGTLMVVGHNPGVEDLVRLLTGCRETMPTAALAHVTLPIDGWHLLEAGVRGELVQLWRPKELDDV